jgi:hypothetical protein
MGTGKESTPGTDVTERKIPQKKKRRRQFAGNIAVTRGTDGEFEAQSSVEIKNTKYDRIMAA